MSINVLSNLVITDVCSISTLYNPKGKRLRRNDRKRWAIVIKYEGRTVYTAKGKQFISDINHIVILPKGCSYEWECVESGHFSTVEFECGERFDEPISFFTKRGEEILKLIFDLEYRMAQGNPMIKPESIRDTYSIILKLLQISSEKYVPNAKRQKLRPAIDHILKNYRKPIKNDELAAIAGMSTVYFRKLFVDEIGVPPISYVKQLRIEKAKEMLQSDYGTISDIALSLGYSSLYDFSRDFKKHTGKSPSNY